MRNSRLLQFVADTLLDGTLLPREQGEEVPPVTRAVAYERQVALSSLLAIIQQDGSLWSLVEQHVDMVRHRTAQQKQSQASGTPSEFVKPKD